MWGAGGIYTGFPTGSAEKLSIVSTSTSDTSNGVGARTVNMIGLDSNWNQISETVTLNGTTPVTSSNSFLRMHTMFVTTAGSSEFNVGTITANHVTTTTNVFNTIEIGINQSQNAAFTVPAGKTGYVRKIHGGIRGAASVAVSAWLYVRTSGSAPRLRRPLSVLTGGELEDTIYGGLRVPEKTDVNMRVTACSANNTEVCLGYDILIVDNS